MRLSLSDFEGVWRLERQITDHRSGQIGTLSGQATLRRAGPAPQARAQWVESGALRYGAGAVLQAERRYHWAQDGAQIAVFFEDGRPFHRFTPDQTAADRPRAHHSCAPDDYRVTYDFSAWPLWRAVWQVKGPRKNYEMTSTLTRP